MPPELTNLPPLTPRQANVVGAMIDPHTSFHDVIAALDIQPAEFFDTLASPEVQTHLDHIRKSLGQRVKIRLADAAHHAVDTLEHITTSSTPPTTDITWQIERRRAATTLLRAHTSPRKRARRKSQQRAPSASSGACPTRIKNTTPPTAIAQPTPTSSAHSTNSPKDASKPRAAHNTAPKITKPQSLPIVSSAPSAISAVKSSVSLRPNRASAPSAMNSSESLPPNHKPARTTTRAKTQSLNPIISSAISAVNPSVSLRPNRKPARTTTRANTIPHAPRPPPQ